MRDIVVTLLFFGLLPMAALHPYIGVGLWNWISLMNPHRLGWGFAFSFPFGMVAALVTLISLFITKDKVKLGRDAIVVTLVLFVIWMSITTAMAFDQKGSLEFLSNVLKIQLMTLVAAAVLQERKHLQVFIWVNVLSLGFYGFKGGIFTILSGGSERVWGPPGGYIGGNNELALALIMTMPFMFYLRQFETRKWIRHGLLAAMLLTAVSAIGTQSRGALLALVAMSAVLWWRGPHKFASLVPIVVVGLGLLVFMPDSWHDRMGTIATYEEDASAMGRINTWEVMTHIANDRITGGGFALYEPQIFSRYSEHRVLAAHSIWFQVLGEHGWIGLFLFALLFVLGWFKASAVRRRSRPAGARPDPQLHLLAGMCQVSIIGFAVGGAFLSLAYFDLFYNVLVMLVVAHRLLHEPATETESQTSESVSAAPSRTRPRVRPRPSFGAGRSIRHSSG